MEEDILNYSPTVMFHGTPCIERSMRPKTNIWEQKYLFLSLIRKIIWKIFNKKCTVFTGFLLMHNKFRYVSKKNFWLEIFWTFGMLNINFGYVFKTGAWNLATTHVFTDIFQFLKKVQNRSHITQDFQIR